MISVMLDAGHGGPDPGAIGHGMREADLTGLIVDKVAEKLQGRVNVSIAPRGTLTERTNAANRVGVDYFLSIHINAGGGTGFESFIHPSAGSRTQNFQGAVHNAIMDYVSCYDWRDRGMKRDNFYVLRETRMSACLIECGFIDHPKDAELLQDDTFICGLSNAIAQGVLLATR